MKKLRIMMAIAIALFGLANKMSADFPKFPVIERFTGVNCGPCASYTNQGYGDWTEANHNKVAIITYHLP